MNELHDLKIGLGMVEKSIRDLHYGHSSENVSVILEQTLGYLKRAEKAAKKVKRDAKIDTIKDLLEEFRSINLKRKKEEKISKKKGVFPTHKLIDMIAEQLKLEDQIAYLALKEANKIKEC
ncbi:MAG: hypothetical protein R6U96_10780 [Promethearchaeia archaeon]